MQFHGLRRWRAGGILGALAIPALCAASLWAAGWFISVPQDLRRPDPALLAVTRTLRQPRDPAVPCFAGIVDDFMLGGPGSAPYSDLIIDHPNVLDLAALLEQYTPDRHIYSHVTTGWQPELPLTSCRREWLIAHAGFIEQLIALAEAGYPAWTPGQLAELDDAALAWLPSPRDPLLVDSEYILVLECRRRLEAGDDLGAARSLAALDRLAVPSTSAPEVACIRAGIAHRFRGARMLDCWLRTSPPSAEAARFLLDALPPQVESMQDFRFILESAWRADRYAAIACFDRGPFSLISTESRGGARSAGVTGALRGALSFKTGARRWIEGFDADWRAIFSAVDSGASDFDLPFTPPDPDFNRLKALDPAAVGLLARELDQLSALHRANIASLTRLAAD